MLRHVTVSGVRATRASNSTSLSPGSSGLAGRTTTTSTRPARSTAQVRAFWDHSHRRYRHTEEWERKRTERYRRLYQLKMRRAGQPPPPKHPSVMFNQHIPWWIPGWGWGRFKSGFSESESGSGAGRNPHKVFWESNPHKSFWETESARAKERMEQFRREIDADPHAALFGSRLVRPGAPGTYDNWFTDLCRTFLGLGSTAESKPVDTTASSRTSPPPPPPPPRTGDERMSDSEGSSGVNAFTESARVAEKNDMEFDPIIGRMVPKSKQSSDVIEENEQAEDTARRKPQRNGSRSHTGKAGFLSSVDSPPRRSEPQESLKDLNASHGALYGDHQEPRDFKQTRVHKSRGPLDTTAREQRPDATTQSIGPEASPPRENVASSGLDAKDTGKDTQEPQRQTESNGYLNSAPNSEALGGAPHSTTNIYQAPKSFVIDDSPDHLEPMLKERQEDLDILTANDIRASYEGKHFEGDLESRKQARKHMEDSFDSYVDPASEVDHQSLRQKYQRTEETGPAREASSGASSDELSQPEASTEQILGEQNVSDNTSPDTYLVLAYDPSTRRIQEAETSSSLHSTDGALHPTKVLRRLHHPAKFLPYFAQMHHGGYEIVSGGGDILVFRKTREAGEYGSAQFQDDLQRPNPYVRHDEDLYEPAPSTESASTTPPAHDTASDDAPDDAPSAFDKDTPESTEPPKARSRFGSALRRMFISGAATAATCYAIGVVVEFLRTGGEDGRGFDAFTEFESERRQRERSS
ncbi:uncharacterized protein BDW47DRAFT_101274 [Aspergillus candidus]|uniref:Serine-threonine rich protein n=1 Tax=Aspergillus candidus TaxID=41067 RepID=A0A2I2FIT3_ASPCN|nr:hypothetical protein BDW47DRAFT_101274 [Aspergillus candidus]PLB40530.1 hypothetical protein BDW47DRAFT_101274 [Aspergillus candidus]